MDKEAALHNLRTAREIFDLSVGAYVLLTEEPARSELSQYEIRYDDAGAVLASKEALPRASRGVAYNIRFLDACYAKASKALVERSLRQMILESLDTVRAYAKASGNDVRTEPWFWFAKHYRDAVAHNGRWDLSRANLPLTCMNLVVDNSHDGKPIDGFLSWYKARQLAAKMALYIEGSRNIH